jgi:general nucleoside transport system permease protein
VTEARVDGIVMSVLTRAIAAGTPLLLGTLGEILSERSGVMNLGVEGMMAMGAISSFIVALNTGSVALALSAAVAAAMLAALIHAALSISFRANQVVSGLAITMMGLGISGIWGKAFIGRPLTTRLPVIAIPLLHGIPVIGRLLFTGTPLFFAGIALGILLWLFLSRTSWGIAIRSVGENPRASEAQGIDVALVRYLCTVAGGAFSGLAGAHLSLSYAASWTEGMSGGRGWIVVALTIFSLWKPLRAFAGAFLFGGIFVLQYLLQPLGISPNLLAMTPYLFTLAVLVAMGAWKGRRHLAAPAALGEAYTRGER